MRFTQEEHTDTGLTDSSTDSIRQFPVNNGFLERKIFAFRAAGFV